MNINLEKPTILLLLYALSGYVYQRAISVMSGIIQLLDEWGRPIEAMQIEINASVVEVKFSYFSLTIFWPFVLGVMFFLYCASRDGLKQQSSALGVFYNSRIGFVASCVMVFGAIISHLISVLPFYQGFYYAMIPDSDLHEILAYLLTVFLSLLSYLGAGSLIYSGMSYNRRIDASGGHRSPPGENSV